MAKPEVGLTLPLSLKEGLSRTHLPGLDGLRMVAVFMVVLYHFGFQASPGGHGVLIFFVLSGFLITWLLLKEQERFGSISLKQFYLRRALRIFPAFYFFWLLLTAALVLFNKHIVWGQALSSFTYLNNYYQAIHGDPNTAYSHTWSLGVEEQFYLIWPVAFIALGRRPRRVATVLASVIGVIWVYRTFLQFGIGVNQEYIYEAFDTRADHLAVGCLLAVLLRRGYLPKVWNRLCSPTMAAVVPVMFIASVWWSELYGSAYRDAIGFAVDPLLIAVLIVQVIALRDSWLWRWLNWRWVRYLGVISYSIYLYQQVVIQPVQKAFTSFPLPVQLGATLAAVVLVASASYYIIERPFLKLKNKAAQPVRDFRRADSREPITRPVMGGADH